MAVSKGKIRKSELKARLQHAVREFGRICTKSNHVVPKEQQVSMDLDNKMIFVPTTQELMRNPSEFKCDYYIQELCFGRKRSEKFKIVTKFFSSEEQEDHTVTPKLDENNELRLYNKDGTLYDTTDETIYRNQGCSIYCLSLDGGLVTCAEVKRGIGIEYFYAHSTLLGGYACLCSGKIRVGNGKIVYIDNDSGHYKPTGENLYVAVKKLAGLFTDGASLGIYSLQVDDSGTETETETKLHFVYYYCPVGQFIKNVDMCIFPDGLIITPYNYFKRMRDFNESYKDILKVPSYKSVLVVKGNAKMAVEHCIRLHIGASYGYKPAIHFDCETRKMQVSFSRKSDAIQYYSLLEEHEYQIRESHLKNNRHYICTYENNGKYVVYASQEVVYSFMQFVLKMNIADIMMVKNEFEKKIS